MRQTKFLIREIREQTDTADINSLTDFKILQYMRDAQKVIQKVIFSANGSNEVFVKQSDPYQLIDGQQVYPLPSDIYAQNAIVGVHLVRDNSIFQTLSRRAFRENETSFGYSIEGRNILLTSQPRIVSAQLMVVRYNYQLPTPSIVLATVDAVDTVAGTITLTNTENLQDGLDRYEAFSTVDKRGDQTAKDLFLTNIDFTTGIMTVEGDLTDVAIGNNLTAGRNSTTHMSMPEEVEPYLLSYVQRRVLGKIASSEITSESVFTEEERNDISDLFADNIKDSLYPVQSDTYFLGY